VDPTHARGVFGSGWADGSHVFSLTRIAWLIAVLLFLGDTATAISSRYLPFDRAVELGVQAAPWGPLAYLMDFTNWTTGRMHAAVAAATVALVAVLWSRRGAVMLTIGSAASLWESLLKPLIHRPRPDASLVHVQTVNTGFSYPSGHATFYTWFLVLLAIVLATRLPARVRGWIYALAVFLALVAALGRVWAGAHWPSDVAGGFLLSVSWVGLVLWVAAWLERRTREPAADAAST
jgi:membrane-associated phospholipid phosphatase